MTHTIGRGDSGNLWDPCAEPDYCDGCGATVPNNERWCADCAPTQNAGTVPAAPPDSRQTAPRGATFARGSDCDGGVSNDG